jgi:hypothetical protein
MEEQHREHAGFRCRTSILCEGWSMSKTPQDTRPEEAFSLAPLTTEAAWRAAPRIKTADMMKAEEVGRPKKKEE